MNTYQEIKNEQPKLKDIFFAFNEKQFQEGKAKMKSKKLLDGGAGAFGTKEGFEELKRFTAKQKERIKKECKPQEVYNYEHSNHECQYTGDDTEALDIVKYYFGENVEIARR